MATQYDMDMLTTLSRELYSLSGNDFQQFVTTLLTIKHGSNQWEAGPTHDGGIDFLTSDSIVQIYGPVKYESAAFERKVKDDCAKIKSAVATHGLPQQTVVFLTNSHFSEKIVSFVRAMRAEGVLVKNVDETAAFVYEAYYPLPHLEEYHRHVCAQLSKEAWPYHIDEAAFVEIVPFEQGNTRDTGRRGTEQSLLRFVSSNVRHRPVFCIGYYGMGKSTIAKTLFRRWDEVVHGGRKDGRCFPFFLNLSHVRLSDYIGDELEKRIVSQIRSACQHRGTSSTTTMGFSYWDDSVFERSVRAMLKAGRIVLIIDGLDEAGYDDIALPAFLKALVDKEVGFLLTCRREFPPFFDAVDAPAIRRQIEKRACWVILLAWGEPQWRAYLSGVRKALPDKEKVILGFERHVLLNHFGDLATRPLFLRMLSDLELGNGRESGIEPALAANLAEVYFRYITWKIADDLGRKPMVAGRQLNHGERRRFTVSAFRLLRAFAARDYVMSMHDVHGRATDEKHAAEGLTLADIRDALKDAALDDKSIDFYEGCLTDSTLLSMIRKLDANDGEDIYRFSHRSFMEYLVAYNLAEEILPENNRERPACGEAWNLFQTHEVSAHLRSEVKRRAYYRGESNVVRMIAGAFRDVVSGLTGDGLKQYNETCEEVLYYVGLFGIPDPELLAVLKRIKASVGTCNATYYRTSCLALAFLEGQQHCEDYVVHLIDGLRHCMQHDFELNNVILERYYGKTALRPTLRQRIERHLQGEEVSAAISLYVFSYFCAQRIPQEQIADDTALLAQVYAASKAKGSDRIAVICSAIEGIAGLRQ